MAGLSEGRWPATTQHTMQLDFTRATVVTSRLHGTCQHCRCQPKSPTANLRSVGLSALSLDSTADAFVTIPTFNEWGMIFLIASMAGCGAWYLGSRVELAESSS
jgi:hypothetical protein